MTHHDDMRDDEFEKYLKRDSALSRRYQDASDDVVPPELDRIVLMQARDAVSNKSGRVVATHSSWWIKWNKPLALAASMMLAVTVIYKVGYQPIERLGEPAAPQAAKQDERDKSSVTGSSAQNGMSMKDNSALADIPSKESRKENARTQIELEKPVLPPPSVPAPVLQKTIPPQSVEAAKPAQASPAPASVAALIEAKQDKQNPSSAVAGNLGKSVEQSRNQANAVVDSVTAEDIGRFPDTSAAESLQRVPNVQIQREADPAKEKKVTRDAETVLQHIRELRKHGKKKEADKAWKQFQIDFPYYEVAADDPARG